MVQKEPHEPVEIEDLAHWNAILATKDINVIDIYAEWCGSCACLVGTSYRNILVKNDEVLMAAKEEGKTIKFWTACAGVNQRISPRLQCRFTAPSALPCGHSSFTIKSITVR